MYIYTVYTPYDLHNLPLAPSIDWTTHLTKLLILKCEWIIEKIPMSAVSMSG